VGAGRTPAHLEKAVELGAIDTFELELGRAVEGADLVILATPVGAMHKLMTRLGPYLKPGAVVTDVGSTKARIVAAAESLMPADTYFVGGHPIAGRENSGVEAASADLFQSAKSILTPTPHTHPDALAQVKELWERLGSQVIFMDVEQHDRILAIISHLPHMVAYSLVNAVIELDNQAGELVDLAAGGFRDFTRIAASDPLMWRDICLSNAQHIIEAIEHFQQMLEGLKQGIKTGNAEELLARFETARRVKQGKGI
jgi:prephenate dehydrogenase